MKIFFAGCIFLLPFVLSAGQAEAEQTTSIVLPAGKTDGGDKHCDGSQTIPLNSDYKTGNER